MAYSRHIVLTAGQRLTILLLGVASVLALLLLVVNVRPAGASPTGSLSQAINNSVLSTDIKDASSVTVASPSFSLGATTIATSCQTTTGTYGSNVQRVYVDNPGQANNGWTLSIAATNGAAAKWQAGPNQYDFDDAAGSGCTNGQLSLDPSVATITLETGTLTGVSLGASDSFSSNSSITLVTADASSDDFWRGYLTGIGISQKIPASTPAGSYSLDLTQTIINT